MHMRLSEIQNIFLSQSRRMNIAILSRHALKP